MKRYISKLPLILFYSFCLVGISLFWINFAEALFFDPTWWKEFEIQGSILLFAIILFSLYWVIEEIRINNFLMELAIEFGIFIALYLIFGFIFRWYQINSWWTMPLQCIPVFIAIYLLRLQNINKDIDYINEKLSTPSDTDNE